jgi:hypothetical protein
MLLLFASHEELLAVSATKAASFSTACTCFLSMPSHGTLPWLLLILLRSLHVVLYDKTLGTDANLIADIR